MEINTGINNDLRIAITDGLSRLLAETYSLYLKTQNYHWNVTGPLFTSLHTIFETQYTELATAVDVIAERIRALGEFAPGSFSKYQELSSIPEADDVPSAEDMVRRLVEANETIVRTIRTILPTAGEANDEATVDLLVGRMEIHEKTAWMLRSIVS